MGMSECPTCNPTEDDTSDDDAAVETIDEPLEALLEAHDRVCREIGAMDETDEWSDGYITGVKEGRNAVEQTIHEWTED